MKKLFALILALAMVLSLAACGSDEPAQTTTAEQTTTTAAAEQTTEATTAAPTTEATTEAPTTEAPTTEATTEAPTTEATTEAPTEPATQSGSVDGDKAAFYADYKNNIGSFTFVGQDIHMTQNMGGISMEMISAKNMVKTVVGENYAMMMAMDGKLYVYTLLPNATGDGNEEAWYVSDVPEGEDPLGSYADTTTEDLQYEEDMVMEYLETVEVDGVKYDKVLVKTPGTDESGQEVMGEGVFWFKEDSFEVWKVEMEQTDETSGMTVTAVMEFFTSDEAQPTPVDPQEKSYDEVTMTYAMAMLGLLYGGM